MAVEINTHFEVSSKLIIFLYVAMLIGIYMEIPLIVGDTYIPAITVILELPILFFILRRKIISNFNFVLLVFAIALLSIIFSRGLEGFDGMIMKLGQFMVALIVFVSFLGLDSLVKVDIKRNVFFIICLVLLVGAFLEYLNLGRTLFDFISYNLYNDTGYKFYDSIERDIKLVGHYRPKFLTSEPSLLATGYFVFSTSFKCLNRIRNYHYYSILMDLIMLFLVGSPIIIFCFVFSIFYYIFYMKDRNIMRSFFVFSILIGLFFGDRIYSIYSHYSDRFSTESIGSQTSINARIFHPYLVGIPKALEYNPFFGVGYGGKELMFELFGISIQNKKGISMEFIDGSNAFARMIMYLGLVGTTILLFFLFRFKFVSGGRKRLYLIVFVLLFFQTLGTFETPRFWGYLAIVFSCFQDASRFKSFKS